MRCSFCHDGLEARWTCSKCHTVLHTDCFGELGRCPSLGCTGKRIPIRRTSPFRVRAAPPTPWGWRRRVGIAAALLAVPLLVVVSLICRKIHSPEPRGCDVIAGTEVVAHLADNATHGRDDPQHLKQFMIELVRWSRGHPHASGESAACPHCQDVRASIDAVVSVVSPLPDPTLSTTPRQLGRIAHAARRRAQRSGNVEDERAAAKATRAFFKRYAERIEPDHGPCDAAIHDCDICDEAEAAFQAALRTVER